jgi:lipopolysaccharide transport system ATP-binding protein
MRPVIQAEGLGKRYRLGGERGELYSYRSLREDLANLVRAPLRRLRGARPASTNGEFWALRDVDFELRPGEALALIGRNGAGKSTLLKILSRITRPTTGRIELRGRVGSLLEVGTGFHPELTGRENVFLNGSILGMSRQEVRRKFDDIVAFAEVEKFLDTPVKRYSSGMYVRLAFAVAAHLDPEVLIVDEVLAVGDVGFQKKCLAKMGDVAGAGRTVLFVSHSMTAVQALCRQAILLEQGRIRVAGRVSDVVHEYLRVSDELSSLPVAERRDRTGEGRFRFRAIEFLDGNRRERGFAVTGEDLYVRLLLDTPSGAGEMRAPLDMAVVIRDQQGQRITELASYFTAESPSRLENTREVLCHVPRLPLLAGQYRLDLWCSVSPDTEDLLADAAVLRVEPGNYFRNYKDPRLPAAEKHGYCMIPQQWQPGACP